MPSSHVDRDAKACLVARASDAPGAVSISVCRAFDQSPPQVLLRLLEGGPTLSIEAAPVTGFRAETAAFLRLGVSANGPRTEVVASASIDGRAWVEIARATLGTALSMRGLGLASKSASPVKALSTHVTREEQGVAAVLSMTAFTAQTAIGAGASGTAFDGIFP